MRYVCFLFIAVSIGFWIPAHAQENPLDQIAASVQLDSVVVIAQKQGFDVRDFIRLVQEDTTFSGAFRRLRTMNWKGHHTMSFVDSRNRPLASYSSHTRQKVVQACREMQELDRKVEGRFFKKNGDFRFITADLYDRVFFTHGRVCNTGSKALPTKESGLDHYYTALKHFIFEPGEEVDVPFIGGKTGLFNPEMLPAYDFQIKADSTAAGKPVYVFGARIKPDFFSQHPNRSIVQYMETRFERSSLQVLERSYRLAYRGLAFRFDVTMFVRLDSFQGGYFPAEVRYEGSWDIPMHPEETGRFSATFTPWQ